MKLFAPFLNLLCALLLTASVSAQDVICQVEINAQKLSSVDPQLVEDMKESVSEFINERKWTSDKFKPAERIQFSILIILNSSSGDNFKGSFQIQSLRPVFNSGYNTTLMNHKDDDIEFSFSRMDVLQYSDRNATQNHLTALLAYYTYLVIGLDYDSFSPEGGTPYLNKALNIVSQYSSSNYDGWKAFENQKNRHWIVNNYLGSRFEPMRSMMYKYHREGLDQMHEDPKEGRAAIFESLKPLEKVYRNMPNNINMRMFFNSKSRELVNIFSEAEGEQKQEVTKLLQTISPGNIQKWNDIQ